MENVHKPSLRPWIAEHINIRKFMDDWCTGLINSCQSIKDKLQLSPEEKAEMEEKCGPQALWCPSQSSVEISKFFNIPEHVELETLRLQKIDVEKRMSDPQYESFSYACNKANAYPSHKIAAYDAEKADTLTYVEIKEPEVILCVQIFRPEKRSNNFYRNALPRYPVFQVDQEFMVLGSQCLTALRDKIDCVSDKAIPGDWSENPHMPVEVTCQDLYKSGFFYIDGVFYNDMRDPDCRDYSQTIIDWSKMSQRGIGPFKTNFMENTKFMDLTIQLGYPYLYMHQGYCEHLIVFNDLFMYTHHHIRNRSEYPIPVTFKHKKRILCMVCHRHTSEWIVFDNKRLPENPFFLCKQCFFNFNYDENNQKIGNFRAYHHIDRSNLV